MNIHILKTPEVEPSIFDSVVDFLSSFDGPLEFNRSYYEFSKEEFYFLGYHLYPYHPFQYPSNDTALGYTPGRGYPLSWRELFSLCNFYRDFSDMDDAFVVLLTKRKMHLTGLALLMKVIIFFVHTEDWELYTEVNPKYLVAYQILENVMQVLMKADIYNAPNAFVHENPRGCMNDLCIRKQEVIIKLQTGNICAGCLAKLKEEGTSAAAIRQTRNIFDAIRNEFLFHEEEPPVDPIPLVIDNKGKILLPSNNLKIQLSQLYKTLYVFLLSKPEGVTLAQLSSHNNELIAIYRKLRPSVAMEDARIRIFNLSHPSGDGFNPIRSRINKAIFELLGDPLADFYKICGSASNPYYIPIPRNIVDIRY
ncbi:MAG: hypothetical protein IPL69_07560 [Saprospiraceae bacterium]|nr:hypothetical protein [Candidatus Brachybacter algidus]